MTLLADATAWLLALVLLLPLAVLIVECWAALPPGRRERPGVGERPPCTVLIPAHNEEAGLPATLRSVREQLRPGDRLVVVADNCGDATAAVARSAGAEVVERHDPERRGKGYALDCGLQHLAAAPPAVVVFCDADCALGAEALDRLVADAAASQLPTQAAFLTTAPAGAAARSGVSAFACRVKNLVRPLGLRRLGLPCLLTGSGIAAPWPALSRLRLAHGNIVEDMQMGLDLALAGLPPRFCADAFVWSTLPSGRQAARSQRTRWEHGHLQTLLTQGPRLLRAAVRQRRPELLGLALELCVPPLSLLLLLCVAALAVLGSWWALGGSPLPALALGGGLALTAGTLLATWFRFGRGDLPASALLALPAYALGKVPIYLAFLRRRQQEWVRTARAEKAPLGR